MANQNAHKEAVATAEGIRQKSKANNNTSAGHKAADIQFYRSILLSGKANGISTGAANALLSLGVDPGGLTAGDT
jgi:hypothetical protein